VKPNHVATASIKKPIHNVKERRNLRLVITGMAGKTAFFIPGNTWLVEPIGIEPMT
jgi:hypothetical protein